MTESEHAGLLTRLHNGLSLLDPASLDTIMIKLTAQELSVLLYEIIGYRTRQPDATETFLDTIRSIPAAKGFSFGHIPTHVIETLQRAALQITGITDTMLGIRHKQVNISPVLLSHDSPPDGVDKEEPSEKTLS